MNPSSRRARIVATIGPATESLDTLRELVRAGMDTARINMSHGDHDGHRVVVERIRTVAAEMKKPVAVMLDISGPKIRTGKLRGGRAVLVDGAEVRITTDEVEGDSTRFSCNYPLLAREVGPGDRVLLSDGELELRVVETTEHEVIARVVHGGVLGDRKGVNLPGAKLSTPSITDKDVRDLQFGLEQGVDIVAQSFVRSANDCRQARELIQKFGGSARLIAKIEKPEAVDHLNEILDVADGVMVARGDLAVETSPEQVPVLQKRIIGEALRAQKTVITATQMLQSMMESPRPTRAEASDVSNAIIDGSDALMLSGETAVGRFPVESVVMMDRIIRATEEIGQDANATIRRSVSGQRTGSFGRAIAEAAAYAADEVGCRFIVVISHSGHMARRIASLRPRERIIALTTLESSCRQLSVSWGVEAYVLKDEGVTQGAMLAAADRALIEYDLAEKGETVVAMAGRLPDMVVSLSMKLHRVGDLA